MSGHDYIRIIRERWLTISVVLTLSIVSALALFFFRPPQYTSSVTLYVSAQNTGETTQSAFQGAQLSQQRVTSYVELVRSRRVMTDVAERLNLDITTTELARKVSAGSALDSVLINVSVTDPSPTLAARIADAIGDTMSALVVELEQPPAPDETPPVALRQVEPANVPEAPSSAGITTFILAAVIAGVAVGVLAALLRNFLDTTIKTTEDLKKVTGKPTIGTIPQDPVDTSQIAAQTDLHSVRSEAYRQIRTNLQYVDVDTPPQLIVVTSSLPAEGKTTTAANLGIALAAAGQRVLLIEADLRRPTLSNSLGMDRSVGLTTILTGGASPHQAIQSWGGGRLDLLSSGGLPPNPSELLGSRQMNSLLQQLRTQYDKIVVDTPPLLPVTDAAALAPLADGVLLLARYKSTTRGQLVAAVASLDAVGANILGVVFSRTPTKGPHKYGYYGYYGSAAQESILVERKTL